MQTHRTDYQAVNAVGTVLRTFGALKDAQAWAKANAETFPGVQIDEVTVTTTSRRVYRPSPRVKTMGREYLALVSA